MSNNKWSIKVGTKNCNTISQVIQEARGLKSASITIKNNRYRAALNILAGEKVIEPIGDANFTPKAIQRIGSISSILFTFDYVLYVIDGKVYKSKYENIITKEGLDNKRIIEFKEKELKIYEKNNDYTSLNILVPQYLDLIKKREEVSGQKGLFDIFTTNNFNPMNLKQVVFLETNMNIEDIKSYARFKSDIKSSKKLSNLQNLYFGNFVIPYDYDYKVKNSELDLSGFKLNLEFTRNEKKAPIQSVSENVKDELNKEITNLFNQFKPLYFYMRKGVNFVYATCPESEKIRWGKLYDLKSLNIIVNYLNDDLKSLVKTPEINPENLKELLKGLNINKDTEYESVFNFIFMLIPSSIRTKKQLLSNIETLEDMKKLKEHLEELKPLFNKLFYALIVYHHYIFIEYMMKYGIQGIQYTGILVDHVRENQNHPFKYTRTLIEGVNKLYLKEETLESHKNVVKTCFDFLNPNSLITVGELDNSYLIEQIGFIFKQYDKYLNIKGV